MPLRSCRVLTGVFVFCGFFTHGSLSQPLSPQPLSPQTSQPARQSARQPARDSYESIQADWHLAGISEATQDWGAACDYFQEAIDESKPLPLDVREWYRGTGYFGLARCEASEGSDSNAIRLALSRAFSHHFWNFDLISKNKNLVTACGKHWLDSNREYWSEVCNEECPEWITQEPIVIYPEGYNASLRWPLIIALHGGNGNYENFAEYWRGVASELRAVVVVPAGVLRESQITNSWGSDISIVEKPIEKMVSEMTAEYSIDPKQVYVAGFSQGAQASIELTLLRPDLFRGAIAMSGFVDRPFSDSVLRIAQNHGVRIYAISGEYEDSTFEAELESIHASSAKVGIPFEINRVEGMIHEIPLDFRSQIIRAWDWLRAKSQAARASEK